MSRENAPEERWVEYMLPQGRGAISRFVESARAGSLLPVYQAMTISIVSALAAVIAWAAGAGAAWVLAPLLGGVGPMAVALLVAARAQARSHQVIGVFCTQETVSGRAYVLSGGGRERRVDPSERLIDLHNDMDELKVRFFQRLDERRPGRRRRLGGLPAPEDDGVAREIYRELMNESLTAMAQAVLDGRLRTDIVLRARMYMHPTYVSWIAGYAVGATELVEGSRRNGSRLHRAVAKVIQWSTEGLRLSQLRRNLIFKPSRALKLFPTRTYLILPEDRARFLDELITLGHVDPSYRPLLLRRFAEGPSPGAPEAPMQAPLPAQG